MPAVLLLLRLPSVPVGSECFRCLLYFRLPRRPWRLHGSSKDFGICFVACMKWRITSQTDFTVRVLVPCSTLAYSEDHKTLLEFCRWFSIAASCESLRSRCLPRHNRPCKALRFAQICNRSLLTSSTPGLRFLHSTLAHTERRMNFRPSRHAAPSAEGALIEAWRVRVE